MALTAKSMFLFDLVVGTYNQNLPFRASAGGPILNAALTPGFYSLTSLANQIENAMKAVDPTHTYNVAINRAVANGTENRLTISTSGPYLDLLFQSGPLANTSCRNLIAFGQFDYTGNVSYTNGATSGTSLITEWYGNNYQPPEVYKKNFGTVNIATNGEKEAITWTVQRFIGVEFKYEPQAKVLTEWQSFINWIIQQKPFDFTPEISHPTVVYEATLEKSSEDGKGLGFNMQEMLPSFPFRYTTGAMTFRVRGE